MMISCEKAVHICDKTQYKEATFVEKLKLKFHLFICKTCSTHSARNTQFTSLCQQANLNSLSEEEKLKMKQQLSKQD